MKGPASWDRKFWTYGCFLHFWNHLAFPSIKFQLNFATWLGELKCCSERLALLTVEGNDVFWSVVLLFAFWGLKRKQLSRLKMPLKLFKPECHLIGAYKQKFLHVEYLCVLWEATLCLRTWSWKRWAYEANYIPDGLHFRQHGCEDLMSRKAPISFIMSVCIEHLGSHWTNFYETRYLSIFRKSVDNDRYFNCRSMYICDNVWRILRRMRDVSGKFVEK
jgi:hypothetical protein